MCITTKWLATYVQLYIYYIGQAEVTKIEEENKKLQDTIKAQDDKAREDLKQSEESKQAIAKENHQLLKELKDLRAYKV